MSEIEIRDVSKVFDTDEGKVQALSHVDINIEKGDIFGIIGMSGAGKSTLVRCLNFLEQPTSGEVVVRGQNLKDLNEKQLRQARTKISMIFQNFNLLMQKTVLDNVCFPLKLAGIKGEEAKKKAREYLEIVGLADKAKNYPAMLSGGQRQRVAIARALASKPEILLCDEATSALDPATTSQILALLKRINKEMGITIVIITHQMSVIQDICHNVAIMENGQVQEIGNVENKNTAASIESHQAYRIVFNEQSAFEPVIANMILTFNKPVNILMADTKNVGGKAKGEMIIDFGDGDHLEQIHFLKERGLDVEEVE